MKKPRLPHNKAFWLTIAEDYKLSQEFMERGTDRQKKSLRQAVMYIKWLDYIKKIEKKKLNVSNVKRI